MVEILFHVDWPDQRLCRDAFVLDWECLKHRQLSVCILLIFNRAANHNVFVSIVPILWDALHEAFDSLGEEKKGAVGSLPDHFPAFFAPPICFLNQKICGKAGIHNPGLQFIAAVL